jgi:hypothetical protein
VRRVGFHWIDDGPTAADHFSAALFCSTTAREEEMAVTSSRREVLRFGYGTAAAQIRPNLGSVALMAPSFLKGMQFSTRFCSS